MSGPASPRDDLRHVEACERCVVKDRCGGVPEGVTPREPILETRSRRRLSLISTVEEQIAREMVTRSIGDREGRALDEEVVRVNFHCNQVCTFCFVSTHLPAPQEEAVRDAIVQAAARGARVILSGGEPTLNPRLVEYVKLARETSTHPVELQTNAVRLEDRALAETLVRAGISEAFVSLHGSRAETSDAITNAPGTFEKTLRGLDNLRELGVRLRVNFVICRSNARELPELVQMCATRWPSAFVNVSFVAPSTDVVPRDRELIPRYDEVLPFVSEAVERASRLGVTIGGFDSMCGIPLCLVPAPLERFFALSTLPEGHDGGEFEKPEACSRCALSSRCHGVRRGYLEMHGDVELRPLAQ
jgi:wyosine [tRNA(Phe)-imidazoG37] synthetase (radical SAM superfamily)